MAKFYANVAIQHQPTHHFILKYVGGAAIHLQNNVK